MLLHPPQSGLSLSLFLTDAVHPEGTPWILLGLDPSVKNSNRKKTKTEKHRLECSSVRKTSAFFVFFAFVFQNFYTETVILLK